MKAISRAAIGFFLTFFPALSVAPAAFPEPETVLKAAAFSEERKPAGLPAGWKLVPAKNAGKRTLYTLVREGESVVLKAVSQDASSGLMRVFPVDPRRYPIIRWRWKVENLLDGSLFIKKKDDFPARLFLSFEADPSKATFRERLYAQAARLIYGDYPLVEGLQYVWAGREPAGTLTPSPYTTHLMTIAVESGPEKLGVWVEEERNFLQDYRRAFGQDPPPLYSVAVMTDTDSLDGTAVAYYGDIEFDRESVKSQGGEQPIYGTISRSSPPEALSERLPFIQRILQIFPSNIDRQGRVFRAVGGVCLLAAALLMMFSVHGWPVWKTVAVIGLACGGAFMLFEALLGWCALRACGLKTPF